MNSAIGSLNNGKRIFLATGKDSECEIFQIKLQPKTIGIGNRLGDCMFYT